MAKRKPKRPSGRVISLAWQNWHIKQHFPSFTYRSGPGFAIWQGTLQPRLSSPVYQIEISYRGNKIPKVKVVSPPLTDGCEHLYKDGYLCLYWPKEWRWGPDRIIAKTILPWTASWLYYYELWLDTGEWHGPSSHENLA